MRFLHTLNRRAGKACRKLVSTPQLPYQSVLFVTGVCRVYIYGSQLLAQDTNTGIHSCHTIVIKSYKP
jgi:hypothetical protein